MSFSVDSNGTTVQHSKYVDGVNEKNMDAFLKALRSGEYEQTTGRLCRVPRSSTGPVGFCCLGVASEVAHQDDPEVVVKHEDVYGLVSYSGQELLAPKATVDWLGIPSRNADNDPHDVGGFNIIFFKAEDVVDGEMLHEYGYESKISATELNDDMNLGFDVIADVFENEFLRKD